MLPKNQRLASNRIEYLLKKGRRYSEVLKKSPYTSTNFFTLKHLPNRFTHSRFCVVVSSKVFPKAVDRNLLRRRLYEIFRLHPELPALPSDIVVIAKIPATHLNFTELKQNIVHTLQNLTKTS